MKRFEVRTTGKVFSSWTDQYCLFRRAREVQGRSFRLAVAGEAIVAAAAFVLALWGRQSPAQLLFFFGGSLLITWHVTGKIQGRDTKKFIKKAREQVLSPEDAAKKLVVSFDEEGCTLSAPGTTLPNQEVESRRLVEYPEVGGLFVSEDYMLVACKKAVSVCFAKSCLTGGSPQAFQDFLEEKCGRPWVSYTLKTKALQAMLR